MRIGRLNLPGNSHGDFNALTVLANQYGSIQDLGSGEKVNPPEFEVRIGDDPFNDGVDLLLVNAERRRLASHAHRTALRFLAGINTYCNSAKDAELTTDRTYPFDFQA